MRTIQNDMTKGSPMKIILSFTFPIFLGNVFQQFYNMADAVIVGKFVGTKALAAVGSTGTIMFLIYGFVVGMTAGFTVLTAQKFGAGDMQAMRSTVAGASILSLIIGIVLTVAFMVFMKPWLTAMNTPDDIFADAYAYIMIISGGILAQMLYNLLASILRALGNSKVPLYFLILSALLNIVLDLVFIIAFGMGAAGAAVATVISQGLSALWILQFLTSRKAILKLRLEHLKPDWKIIRSIIALGTTGFVMGVTNSVVQIFANSTLATFGGDLYVGVMTVLNSIREIVQMPANGITSGAQPVLGYNYGAKRPDRVKQGIRFLTLIGILYTLVAWGILYFFPHFFISIFNNDDALRQAAEPALKIYFFGFFMMSLQFVAQSVFVALGQAKQAVFFSIFRKIIIVVPLTLILPHCFGLGVNGVFLAEPISNFLGGLASFGTMYWTIYRQIDKEDQQ